MIKLIMEEIIKPASTPLEETEPSEQTMSLANLSDQELNELIQLKEDKLEQRKQQMQAMR